MHPKISIVIPAFNEAMRLPRYLERVRSYLNEKYPNNFEILVVNDGSTDDTSAVVRKHLGTQSLITLPKNTGKGAAVRCGMLRARGSLRLFTDADGSTPIEEEERLRRALEAGADVAIGSRAAPGGTLIFQRGNQAKPPPSSATPQWHVKLHRFLIGRLFARHVQILTGLPYRDTQCGFKMFKAHAADAIFSRTNIQGFAFDVEALYIARRLTLRVEELPVTWSDSDGSRVRLLSDPIRMARDIARIKGWHAALTADAMPVPLERQAG